MSVIKNILFITKENKKEFYTALVYYFLHSFLLSAPSGILVMVLFELLKQEPNQTYIFSLILLMALFFIMQLFLSAKANVKASVLSYAVSKNLRLKLGNHLFKLGLGTFNKKNPSYLSSLLLEDIRSFENYFSHGVPNLLSGFFSIIILFIFLFILDYKLAGLLFLGIVAMAPFIYLAKLIVSFIGKKHIENRNHMAFRFLEFCQGMKYIKAFNVTKKSKNDLKGILHRYKKSSLQIEMFPGPAILISFIFCELAFLLMIYFSLEYFDKKTLDLPVLITFLILGYRVYDPIKLFMVDFLQIEHMNSGLNRVLNILDLKTLDGKSNTLPTLYDIEFKNVSFSYENEDILKNIDLKFKHKTISAIVGLSGEGKSTILSLIARFWDVNKGQITIGGKDIKNLSLNSLYTLISQVFQEVYLYDDTIYYNIKLAKPKAKKEEIIEACKKASCLEFINNLEYGFETKVGEGAVKLSGGEKQRISIARAFLKDSPIILLDEVTASLDSLNEKAVQKSIYELTKDKTVIIIAHKLATIKNVDNIYVLENKNIIREGTHKELILEDGLYKQMWQYQQKSKGWKI